MFPATVPRRDEHADDRTLRPGFGDEEGAGAVAGAGTVSGVSGVTGRCGPAPRREAAGTSARPAGRSA